MQDMRAMTAITALNVATFAASTSRRCGVAPKVGLALLRRLEAGRLDVSRMTTHHFTRDHFERAYQVFADPDDTGALKVVLTRG